MEYEQIFTSLISEIETIIGTYVIAIIIFNVIKLFVFWAILKSAIENGVGCALETVLEEHQIEILPGNTENDKQ